MAFRARSLVRITDPHHLATTPPPTWRGPCSVKDARGGLTVLRHPQAGATEPSTSSDFASCIN